MFTLKYTMKNFEESQLRQLYIDQEKTPNEIAGIFGCDHKTIRKYLRLHQIPLRSASEYNYLCKKTHTTPTPEELHTPLSLKAHIAYLCEGWHTENTTGLNFCNTDPLLINLMVDCLQKIYRVTHLTYVINANTEYEAKVLLLLYPNAKTYIEEGRKTPIIRLKAGGKVLAREFISNAYALLREG